MPSSIFEVNGGYAYGASEEVIEASNNIVNFGKNSKVSFIYGGYATNDGKGEAKATHNVVKVGPSSYVPSPYVPSPRSPEALSVRGGETFRWVISKDGEVVKGEGKSEASYNVVEITGPNLLIEICGGKSSFSRVNPVSGIFSSYTVVSDNQIALNNVSFFVMYGAFADVSFEEYAELCNNHISTNSGEINGDIYVGYATGGNVKVTNNELTLSGKIVFNNFPNIYGGFIDDNEEMGDIFTGNTLKPWNYTGTSSAGIIANFQNYDFILPDSLTNGETLLSAKTVVFGNSKQDKSSRVTGISFNPESSLKVGDHITLISTSEGITGKIENDGKIIQTPREGLGNYKFQLFQENNDLKAQFLGFYPFVSSDQALLEGYLAGLAFVNQGADLIKGIQFSSQGNGPLFFMTTQEGSSRYECDNWVDVGGWSLLSGLALKKERKQYDYLISAFFEMGCGEYDSCNVSASKGTGELRYTGGGIFSRFDFKFFHNFYIESFLRVGCVENEFSKANNYLSSTAYYGFGLEAGYGVLMANKINLDFYGKYSCTHISEDSFLLEGVRTKLEGANSHRLRGGARISYHQVIKGKELLIPYLGLAYEGEFDGKVSASNREALTIKGCTGIGEVGVSFKPSEFSSLSLDLSVQGFIGVRQGVAGKLNLKKLF